MTDSDTPATDSSATDTPSEPTSPEGSATPEAPIETAPESPAGPATTETTEIPAAAPATAGVAAAPAPAGPRSSHVMVPKWLAFTVAGLLLVAIGFGAGWFLNDDEDGTSAAVRVPEVPILPDPRPFDEPDSPAVESSAFLGVSTAPTDDDSGVRVAAVLEDSPADDAGLRADDVIVEVDGEIVTTPRELVEAIQTQDPGDEVAITYERDGDSDTVDVTLVERENTSRNARPS